MKRIFLILLVSLCAIAPEAQAEVSAEPEEKIELTPEMEKEIETRLRKLIDSMEAFELFTACAPMDLSVELSTPDTKPDTKKINLTEEAIRNSVESRLRSGRIFSSYIRTSSGDPYYRLNVDVMVIGPAFSISIEFNKFFKDSHFPELEGVAITWNRIFTGTHAKDSGYILSSLSQAVDGFLVEYFRVNEKACKKIR